MGIPRFLDAWSSNDPQISTDIPAQGSVRPFRTRERLFALSAICLFLLHLAVLLGYPHPQYLSNAIQTIAPALAMLVCGLRVGREPDPMRRMLWRRLRVSFGLWMGGQACWFLAFCAGWKLQYPSIADLIWLSFSFPVLLVIAKTSSTNGSHDRVAWLDLAQATVGLLMLYALVFAPDHYLKADLAYDVQSVSLLLACGLRLSLTKSESDRRFFRDLTIYLAVYGMCSFLGSLAEDRGWLAGSLCDLAWTFPFVTFCLLVLRPGRAQEPWCATEQAQASAFLRKYQTAGQSRGLSAVGLTVLSMTAAGYLCLHLPVLGVCALALVFMIFAARTAIREQQLESAHSSLESQTIYDSLTGLANRVLLKRELERALELDPSGSVAVLTIDLDRFKTINDSLGHVFGDRLLIKIAALLQHAIRPGDLLARLGGDEFAVLLRNVTCEAAAESIASRIVVLLRDPVEVEGRINHLTASVGTVCSSGQSTAEEMLRNADCAMYEAKGAGRNGTKLFSPVMQRRASHSLEIETELRQALETGGIEAWYQPIYDLDGRTIHGFEALVRWRHATRGMISPGDFIPIAEDTGLILELGRQVLRQACAHLREWNARFHTRLTMSVNISVRQFSDPRLLDTILEALAETDLDPSLLRLEITESVLLCDPQAASEVLAAARALGIQICLDDFGTGYSSLSYLLDFPFDAVKIDRSFVKNMEQDSRRLELVRTIMHLVRQLGKQVVSEGVETEGEMACLRELNYGLVQGFLLSKPLPADRLVALLTATMPNQNTDAALFAMPGRSRGREASAAGHIC